MSTSSKEGFLGFKGVGGEMVYKGRDTCMDNMQSRNHSWVKLNISLVWVVY